MPEQNIEDRVIAILKHLSGRKVITPDQMIGRDIDINGWDSVDAAEQIEEEFAVDLRPLIDAHTIVLPRTWFDRMFGTRRPYADATVREVVDYIAKELRRRAG